MANLFPGSINATTLEIGLEILAHANGLSDRCALLCQVPDISSVNSAHFCARNNYV